MTPRLLTAYLRTDRQVRASHVAALTGSTVGACLAILSGLKVPIAHWYSPLLNVAFFGYLSWSLFWTINSLWEYARRKQKRLTCGSVGAIVLLAPVFATTFGYVVVLAIVIYAVLGGGLLHFTAWVWHIYRRESTLDKYFDNGSDGNMIRIFLSYAHEDYPAARRLYDDLATSDEFTIWLDKLTLRPGQRWQPAIRRAIRDAQFVLLLLSTHSIGKTGFYQKEIRLALDVLDEHPEDDIFVMPIRLDDCTVTNERLRELQYVDLFPDWNEGLARIRRTLTSDLTWPKRGTKGFTREP